MYILNSEANRGSLALSTYTSLPICSILFLLFSEDTCLFVDVAFNLLNIFNWSELTFNGSLKIVQATFSVHGGPVNDPVYLKEDRCKELLSQGAYHEIIQIWFICSLYSLSLVILLHFISGMHNVTVCSGHGILTWIIEIEMRLIMDGDNLKKIGDSFSQPISIKNACMDGWYEWYRAFDDHPLWSVENKFIYPSW